MKKIIGKIRDFWARRWHEVRQRPIWAVLAVGAGVGFWLWMGPRAGILWLLYLLFVFYRWDERVFGVAALLALVSCPILLQLKRDQEAETMAVYAFFFLTMTVTAPILVDWGLAIERLIRRVRGKTARHD